MSGAERTSRIDQASRWIYGGLWSILVRWFRVPEHPPTLPVPPGETMESFRPSDGFLRYLKFKFWLGLTAFDGVLTVAYLVLLVAAPLWGAILFLPYLVVAILPDIVAYIAIHLQYDTTWYVMTGRSLRIRRGIWTIHETTITFENVQNVTVNQGPLQRWFGISDVLVETAGGGGKVAQQQQPGLAGVAGHRGLIEGIADAQRIRDLILARLRRSRTAGLGDEHHAPPGERRWTREETAVLREIRDLCCRWASWSVAAGINAGDAHAGQHE